MKCLSQTLALFDNAIRWRPATLRRHNVVGVKLSSQVDIMRIDTGDDVCNLRLNLPATTDRGSAAPNARGARNTQMTVAQVSGI